MEEPDNDDLVLALDVKYGSTLLRQWRNKLPPEIAWPVKRVVERGFKTQAEMDAIEKEEEIKVKKVFIQKLGSEDYEKLKMEKFYSLLAEGGTFLIDLPDYDRNNRSQMIKDLNEIHKFWESLKEKNEGYRQCNLVLFMQKELFHGHFFFGKMDIIDLELVQAEQLMTHYISTFGSTDPFTQDALEEIAYLSRGIFRRFKKYVRICLDNYYNSITVETERKKERKVCLTDVQEWITIQQLIKDMELELSGLFPKQKDLRNYTVILLRKLQKNGETEQQLLVKEVFGSEHSSEMKASRVLEKLESYGYIQRRVHDNNRKTVSLNDSVTL